MSEQTIKIQMLTSVAGGDYMYAAGELVDAPVDRARDLLQAGHAALANGKLAEPPVEKSEKAVSKAAANSEKR